jgi:hypothetical protein
LRAQLYHIFEQLPSPVTSGLDLGLHRVERFDGVKLKHKIERALEYKQLK